MSEAIWYQSYDSRGNRPHCTRLCRLPWAEQWPLIIDLAIATAEGRTSWRNTSTYINETYWYWPHPLSETGWWMVPYRIDRRVRELVQSAAATAIRAGHTGSARAEQIAAVLRKWRATGQWRRAALHLRTWSPPASAEGDATLYRLYRRAAAGQRVEMCALYPRTPERPIRRSLGPRAVDLFSAGYLRCITLPGHDHTWSSRRTAVVEQDIPTLQQVLRSGTLEEVRVGHDIFLEATRMPTLACLVTVWHVDHGGLVSAAIVPRHVDVPPAFDARFDGPPSVQPLTGPLCILRQERGLEQLEPDDRGWLSAYVQSLAWAWLSHPAQPQRDAETPRTQLPIPDVCRVCDRIHPYACRPKTPRSRPPRIVIAKASWPTAARPPRNRLTQPGKARSDGQTRSDRQTRRPTSRVDWPRVAALRANGMTLQAIADQFGVTKQAVSFGLKRLRAKE